ncbi:stage III sporulation protein AB [uncultured Ruminococcus sp.]|uniref:stage III sporulation protein AB n=1 Tax=uncultured Ruminococcus sp. TaxID=165186 RepID=UPI0025CBC756|nr:stage III sporulation protein AB [uncultured Ruminococcus sp.]
MALKILGGLLLVMSGFSAGWFCSKKLLMRKDFFKRIISFISNLSTQLRYSTSDIFTLVSLSANTSGLYFFEIREESGTPFYKVWSERVSEIPAKFGLKNSDRTLLLEFGEQLGKTDVDGQLKHLELYEALFKKQLTDAENEINKKSKLYKTMGFFVGTAAALMII